MASRFDVLRPYVGVRLGLCFALFCACLFDVCAFFCTFLLFLSSLSSYFRRRGHHYRYHVWKFYLTFR